MTVGLRRRTVIFVSIPLLVLALASAGLFWMVRSLDLSSYGAQFSYPPEPKAPADISVAVRDRGWDDDDPMRIRVQVVDAPGVSQEQLAAAYGQGLTEADGWTARHPAGAVLCLFNDTRPGYRQILEIWPYVGSRVEPRPGRYLVMNSRILPRWNRVCGEAGAWIPSDLVQ